VPLFDYHCSVTVRSGVISADLCQYSTLGAPFGPFFLSVDLVNPDGSISRWSLDASASGFRVDASSSISPSGTSGTYSMLVSAVPEPSSFVLEGIGLAGLVASLMRRRGPGHAGLNDWTSWRVRSTGRSVPRPGLPT
jgi:hypothetical protein